MFAKALKHLFIIAILMLLEAPASWGFSVSETAHYLEKAKNLKLWNEPKWLFLGHYEKNLFGYKSAFRGPLFLHEAGFDSPKDEMLATLNAFFSDSTELTKKYGRHPQCQFLARRKWLIEKLQIKPADILPCTEREIWKKQLGAASASLIFASSDLSNPASSFGHTFLKLINPANAKNKDLIDYGVNYAADGDENEGFFYAFKGLFGMYSGRFTMLPYHQKIREYLNLEGRDIWEYQLALSPEEVDELVSHLLELDGSVSPYYFFSNNCSYQLLVALDAIKPSLALSARHSGWVNPIDTVKTFSRTENLISAIKYKPSLKTDYLSTFVKLNSRQKSALNEVIDHSEISSPSELNIPEKSAVYETALKYLAVTAYRTQKDYDNEKYKISTLRAALGKTNSDEKEKPAISPELSHDSSALYFGYGKNPASDFASLKFRATFHDIEQTDAGIVPFSQNTLGAFEVRYYSELRKLSLERVTVLNLINTNPVTPLDRNYSWKVRIDVLDQFRPDVEFGGGLSFDLGFLKSSRIAYFFSGRYLKSNDDVYQAGPEILFVARPLQTFGFSVSLGYFAANRALPYLRFATKLNFELAQNYDFQVQANDQKEYQLSLVRNFIF